MAAERSTVMEQQLRDGTYDCAICTEGIRPHTATWSCHQCYRVYHLFCTKKWAKSEGSGAGRSFRCPSCQHEHPGYPNKYKCFCGKTTDPKSDGFVVPHSCGEVCNRARGFGCTHKCAQSCHPGPCPECTHMSEPVSCPCGKNQYVFTCGTEDPKQTCGETCGKMLSCGKHKCERECHHGPCKPCALTEVVKCPCGKEQRTLSCGTSFNCSQPCDKTLRCGTHKCEMTCHTGGCPPCDNDPAIVTSCPCGKVPLDPGARMVCTDPIKTCGSVCGKVLSCGNHECEQKCHLGQCKPCDKKIMQRCPCGYETGKVWCREADQFQCHKVCKAKMSCGKHDCQVACCPARQLANAPVHTCTRTCEKKLPCGHTCGNACHRGACPPCDHIVTTEISCACGAEVLEPPLPCGTQPPVCNRPCQRVQECGHDPIPHTCHSGDCPPCIYKVDRPCIGGHTTVKGVLCSSTGVVSCGHACGKQLDCLHQCQRKCHGGDCIERGKTCQQKCGHPQVDCDHKCQAQCHPGKPCLPCSAKVKVNCDCGGRSEHIACKEYQVMARASSSTPTVECNRDCLHANRLGALASLRAPPPATDRFGAPPSAAAAVRPQFVFSARLWSAVHDDFDGVVAAEKHLENFIRSRDKVKVLPAMAKTRRTLVHELAHFYNIGCEVVDQEPNRTCVLSRLHLSRIPQPLLSALRGEDKHNPTKIARSLLAQSNTARHHCLVLEGAAITLAERAVHGILRNFVGEYIAFGSATLQEVLPASITAPRAGGDYGYWVIVFPHSPNAANAFGQMRRNGCPCTFHMFGEGPPRSNFAHQDPNLDAKIFITDPFVSGGGGGGGGGGGKKSSWANAVRTTARQKERAEPKKVETSNKFSALRR